MDSEAVEPLGAAVGGGRADTAARRQLASVLSRTADTFEDSAAFADAHAERYELAGRDDAVKERRVAGRAGEAARRACSDAEEWLALPAVAEAVGRWPGFLSQARHMIAVGDGVSVPAVGAGEGRNSASTPSDLLGSGHTNGRDWSTVSIRTGPAVRILISRPDCLRTAHCGRGAERGLLVLAAAPVSYVLGRYPAGPVDASRSG